MGTFSNFRHGKETMTLIVEKRLYDWSKRHAQSDWHRYESITDAFCSDRDVSVRILFAIRRDGVTSYNGLLGYLPGRFRKRLSPLWLFALRLQFYQNASQHVWY